MDRQRLLNSLKEDSKIFLKDHIVLKNGSHSDAYIVPDLLKDENMADQDGYAYVVSHDLAERVSNDNINFVYGDSQAAKNVAGILKCKCEKTIPEGDDVRYVMVFDILESDMVNDLNVIMRSHSGTCVMVCAVISMEIGDGSSLSSMSYYYILEINKPKAYNWRSCPMCKSKVPVTLNLKEDQSNGRGEQETKSGPGDGGSEKEHDNAAGSGRSVQGQQEKSGQGDNGGRGYGSQDGVRDKAEGSKGADGQGQGENGKPGSGGRNAGSKTEAPDSGKTSGKDGGQPKSKPEEGRQDGGAPGKIAEGTGKPFGDLTGDK